MVLQYSSHAKVGIFHRAMYVAMQLAITTGKLFHNFYCLDPYFFLKLIILFSHAWLLYWSIFEWTSTTQYVEGVAFLCLFFTHATNAEGQLLVLNSYYSLIIN